MDDLDRLYTTDRDYEVRGLKSEGEVFGDFRTIVVMWHEGTARKQAERFRRLKEGCLKVCRDLEERVGGGGRGRKFTVDGVRRELEPFDEVSDAFDWSFDEEGQSFSWKFDEGDWSQILEGVGKSLLFTSREDWSAERIVRAYGGRWRVERSFRLLKGPVPLRPVYHWEEERVREHCFLIFLLLVIHRFLMEEIREPVLEEFGVGEEAVLHLLRGFDLVTGKRSDSSEPSFSLEEPDEIQEVIIDSLGLERFIPD